jgi:hypothetical protein
LLQFLQRLPEKQYGNPGTAKINRLNDVEANPFLPDSHWKNSYKMCYNQAMASRQ